METIVRPMTWHDFPGDARARFEALRTPGAGEVKVLDENFFIEQALRATSVRGLSDDDLDVYRAPYPSRDSRRPLLEWPAPGPSRDSQRTSSPASSRTTTGCRPASRSPSFSSPSTARPTR
jgi:hypothetical protein